MTPLSTGSSKTRACTFNNEFPLHFRQRAHYMEKETSHGSGCINIVRNAAEVNAAGDAANLLI